MQVSDIPIGAGSLEGVGALWIPVACPYHDGLVVVDGNDAPLNEVPIYSQSVGFQPDCDACAKTAEQTIDRMTQAGAL